MLEYNISNSSSFTNTFNLDSNLDEMEFGFTDDEWETYEYEVVDDTEW